MENKLSDEVVLDIVSKDEYFFKGSPKCSPWVQRVAREHWGPRFHQYRHFTGRSFLGLVQSGRFCIEHEDGRLEEIRAGFLMYLAGGNIHRVRTQGEQGGKLLVVLVGDGPGVLLVEEHLGRESRGMALADPTRVAALFSRVLECGEKGGWNAARIASSLMEPILLTLVQEHQVHDQAVDRSRALFARCRSYLEQHWREIDSVGELPSRFGVSQPHLGRLFKRYEGCSPHHFYLQCKMTYALYEIQQGTELARLGSVGISRGENTISKTLPLFL